MNKINQQSSGLEDTTDSPSAEDIERSLQPFADQRNNEKQKVKKSVPITINTNKINQQGSGLENTEDSLSAEDIERTLHPFEDQPNNEKQKAKKPVHITINTKEVYITRDELAKRFRFSVSFFDRKLRKLPGIAKYERRLGSRVYFEIGVINEIDRFAAEEARKPKKKKVRIGQRIVRR